jgi:hypothetical protein
VAAYLVYRDGVLVASLNTTKWNDTLTFRSGARTYAVVAKDAAGNVSPTSTILAIR